MVEKVIFFIGLNFCKRYLYCLLVDLKFFWCMLIFVNWNIIWRWLFFLFFSVSKIVLVLFNKFLLINIVVWLYCVVKSFGVCLSIFDNIMLVFVYFFLISNCVVYIFWIVILLVNCVFNVVMVFVVFWVLLILRK